MVFRYIQSKFLQLSLNFIRNYHNNHHFSKNGLVRRRLINSAPNRLYTVVAATTNRMFAPKSMNSTTSITSTKPYKLASSIATEVGKMPMLLLCMFLKVERVPFSNRLHFTFRSIPKRFSIFRTRLFADFIVKATMEEGTEVLPSTHEKTLRVASIARKLGQGMRDTLGLKSEFKIMAYEPGNELNPVWTIGQRSGQAARRSSCDIGSKKWFIRRYSTKHLEEAEWKVTVLKTPTFNAYVAPGKHIFVLTKLMDSCTDEELASIIGHEMGHAIGQHKTDFIMVDIVGYLLQIALKNIFSSDEHLSSTSNKKNELTHELTQIVKNYLSRRLELEADYIGMMLMATAGYDPRVAPMNLSRANFAHGGETHPDGCDRVEYLNDPERMKKAMCLFREYQLHNQLHDNLIG